MTPCTAALIKWEQAQHDMSSVTRLHDQPWRPASSCYQPPFNCIIKWKFRAVPLVTYKAEVTFKKAKTTTLKFIMEKSVLGAKSISKHRLNEGSDNSVSLLPIAQVKQMQLNQNPCFLAPRLSSTPPHLPTQPSFHNENSNVISFSCRAGLKQGFGTYKETTRLLGSFLFPLMMESK